MILSFEEMPETARLWIYQADRQLTEEEEKLVSKSAEAFINQWTAHGQDLKASYHLSHRQFLIISVDESLNLASGCSIDSSVDLVRGLENDLGVTFFDRTKIAFFENGEVNLYPIEKMKTLMKEGTISENTLVFNNLVSNIAEWKDSWLIPSSESWVKRYFH